MTLFEQLTDYQKRNNLTHTALANKLGITYNLLYKMLAGIREPTQDNIDKMSKLLGVRYNVSIPLTVLEKIKANQPDLEQSIKDLLNANGSIDVGLRERQISEQVKGDYLELGELYGISQCRIGKEYKNE